MKKIAILLGFCMVVAFLPTFIPQPVSAMTGSGTVGDPYVIYNVTDLQNMNLDLDAYYVLGNDIDASATSGWNGGAGFIPVNNFAGHFDGNFSTVRGLYMNWADTYVYLGLFGRVLSGAHIHNVQIVEVDISHTISGYATSYVGALVGYIWDGTNIEVSQVYVQGEVSTTSDYTAGDIYAGGMIGMDANSNGCHFDKCAANVDVTATHNEIYNGATAIAGGFVGYYGASAGDNDSHIYNSYARGDATASAMSVSRAYAGGFVGRYTPYSYPTCYIDNCYSTGAVAASDYSGGFSYDSGSQCTDSFWDVQTSGLETSGAGTGKTTAKMKTESTFTGAGWDFDTIWTMPSTYNDGYPALLWWYDPPVIISDVNQVVWFQPNAIIEGIILPNRAQNGTLTDGEFTWGANPEGITISHGELIPEEEYDFEPVIPSGQDIINPEPETMTADVDTERLKGNPLYPFVQVLSIGGFLNERLVWLGLAWFILIAAMFGVHLGFDTRKDTEKPQHFILTTITGLGLSIMFYTMGIFPWWVILLMAFGLLGAIIWERQPVL